MPIGRRLTEAQKKKRNEKYRKWYAANQEKQRERSRKWYAANPEKSIESHRKWYAANPEKSRERNRAGYYKSHGTPKGRAGLLLSGARKRSNKIKVSCTITREWILERLLRGYCEMTGLPFDFQPAPFFQFHNPRSPSLDRTDSHGGYTPDNVKVVVTAFNIGRGQWSYEEYEAVARAYLEKNCA